MNSPYDFYITPEEYDIAEKNGISKDLLNRRVRESGWDKEVAMSKPSQHGSTGWHLVKEIAKEHGISYWTFKQRRRAGMELMKAATVPPRSPKECIALANKARGVREVFTKEEIKRAEANGVSYYTLASRVRKYKWDLEQAITTPTLSFSECGKRGRAASSWAETMYIPKVAPVQVYQAQ
ncbi:TPA: hypothetical protein QCY14_004918 [Bacillus pacificus]|nr:hypothetical protein [Bacillus pacificus]